MEQDPFKRDEELAKLFNVSVQTIRLDRLELGIPELRERLKTMAEQSHDKVRSLQITEVIGEIIDLQLDREGISVLEITEEQAFSKTKLARGHHIFAQANSLAIAVINEEVALTYKADIRFVRPVHIGEKLVAKARVKPSAGDTNKGKVEVRTYVGEELVFRGVFHVYRVPTPSTEGEKQCELQ